MAESSEFVAQLWDVFRPQLRASWERGERLGIETLLQQQDATHINEETLLGLICNEFNLRREFGDTPSADEYVGRFPQHAERLVQLFASDTSIDAAVDPVQTSVAENLSLTSPAALTSSNADSSDQPTLINHDPSLNSSAFAFQISKQELEQLDASTTGMLPVSVSPGQKLGPYEILEKLGEGGMGVVYKARNTRLNKLVALKVLSQQLMANPQAVARFDREMQAVGKVEHPHIVRAMHADEYQGLHCLVMEYVEGTDLGQLVKQGGPLSVPDACEIIRQTALALQYAHELGLIHRDVKPSNLLRSKSGQVKLLDLGLASLAQEDGLAANLTGTGQVLGTPDYMSPEQWEDTRGVDGRADLYALGCTLFYLLVGHAPFGDSRRRSVVSKMKAHVNDLPPDLAKARPEVPTELAEIYSRLMAKDPDERYATAAELAEALQPFAINEGALSPSASSVATTSRSPAGTSRNAAPLASLEQPKTAQRSGVDLSTPRRRGSRVALAAYGLTALVLLAGIIIKITPQDGTTTEISVQKGSKIEIVVPEVKGRESKTSHATGWHGWPIDAPPPAVAPFDAAQAKQHQAAWARHLNLPVEFTNTIGMKFMLIPPGEFTMGSTQAVIDEALTFAKNNKPEQELIKHEMPQHKVILTQPFYLGAYEVTQAEYSRVLGKSPSAFARTGPDKACAELVAGMVTATHPVELVSWNDAAEFCARLSRQENLKPHYRLDGDTVLMLEGSGYRLPTEAEWEFACRAGTTTRYWIGDGDEQLLTVAWFGPNSGGRTHSVGELPANPLGLFDVHGNVWEWVQDGWAPGYYSQFQDQPAVDPQGPSSFGSLRVDRGGGWFVNALTCRSAGRYCRDTTYSHSRIGFRAALMVDAVRKDALSHRGTR